MSMLDSLARGSQSDQCQECNKLMIALPTAALAFHLVCEILRLLPQGEALIPYQSLSDAQKRLKSVTF